MTLAFSGRVMAGGVGFVFIVMVLTAQGIVKLPKIYEQDLLLARRKSGTPCAQGISRGGATSHEAQPRSGRVSINISLPNE